MQLSEHFSLNEFTNSETAKKDPKKYAEQFNPPANIIENLKYGAVNVAEPIRAKFGPFAPTCAYRCPALNTQVTGNQHSTSMHLTAEALDETFIIDGKNQSDKVFFWLIENKKTIPFTELIWEKGDVNEPNWLHIGWRKQKEQEIMVFINGKYINYFDSSYYKEHKKKGLIK